jgi:hypothetical protein
LDGGKGAADRGRQRLDGQNLRVFIEEVNRIEAGDWREFADEAGESYLI